MKFFSLAALSAALCATLCSGSAAQVPFERIANADKEPGNWLTYSRNYQGQRFSPLNEIDTSNVAKLKVRWALQFPAPTNEVSPIVVDNIMYVTGPNSAAAIDARTGRTLWTWKRPIPSDYHSVGFGRVNRGPAVLDDKLFVTTLDCYLVALDLKSGAQLWISKVGDYKAGYSMTVAPLAIDGKVVVGVSGGEAGIRGFVDAYDAKSGEQAWRFWTIPGPGEPGHETWTGDSWKTGGGSTWVTGAFDPDLKLIYWGVGNPGPDWNGDVRPGDNLYTCSLLALDADTGKLRWYFQFTPHETHDWDAAHVPILFDAKINGRERKLIANANRNAFYYVLDRGTGEFIAGRPYAKQTWARGLDSKGHPIVLPDTEPTEKGALVWPNANGATVWFSPSYSPQTSLFYVAVREIGSVYFKRSAEYKKVHSMQAVVKMNYLPTTHRAKFALSTQLPESCVGNSSFIPLRGLECFPPRAVSSFPVPMKAISTRSMHEPENRCGTFNPAAPSAPIPSPSTSMDTSASPSVRTRCSTFSVCEVFGFLFVFMTGHFVRALIPARKSFLLARLSLALYFPYC